MWKDYVAAQIISQIIISLGKKTHFEARSAVTVTEMEKWLKNINNKDIVLGGL